jgi:hypothetical protein
MSALTACPHCHARVALAADRLCPSCRNPVDAPVETAAAVAAAAEPETQSRGPGFRAPIIAFLASFIIGWLTCQMAREIESGKPYHPTGRRRAIQQLLHALAENLGSTWCAILWVVLSLASLLWLIWVVNERTRLRKLRAAGGL